MLAIKRARARARGVVVLLLGWMALSGCADRSTADFDGRRPIGGESLVVDVDNQNFGDVVVSLSRDGTWQRLGTVTGISSTRLEVPDAYLTGAGHLRIRAHVIGSRDAQDFVSDAILAGAGDVIQLRVAPALNMSSWSVRARS